MKKGLLALFLSAVTAVTYFYAGKLTIGLTTASGHAGGKPNILVLSVCSMRKDLFTAYGRAGEPVMPAAERFLRESSVVFEKAFNGVPWISFISFMERYFPLMTAQGYLSASPYWEYPYVRVPLQKARQAGIENAEEINDSLFEKDYKAYAELVKNQILLPRSSPFALIVHVKYLHYPLIDRFNPEAEWDFYLSAEEKARVTEYLAHPEKYFRKLPLLLMLTSDAKYAAAHPDVRRGLKQADAKTLRALTGLVSNPRFLREWEASEGYEQDLLILKKAYAGNARHLDRILEPMFNLYGDRELQRSTVVVFTGDHGEMHMERGELTHANSGFDEGLMIPAAIRFPKDWLPQIREKAQFHIHRIADLVEGVMNGEVDRANLSGQLESLREDVFVFRDCRNTLRGLRYQNKYKYFVEASSGARHLFDLERDPGELANIAGAQPEVADRMEALYWENLGRFSWIPPYRCEAW